MIKSETGQEVNLEQYKKHPVVVSSPIVPCSPAQRTVQVWIETEEVKRKWIAEEAKQREREAAGHARMRGASVGRGRVCAARRLTASGPGHDVCAPHAMCGALCVQAPSMRCLVQVSCWCQSV